MRELLIVLVPIIMMIYFFIILIAEEYNEYKAWEEFEEQFEDEEE